MDSSRRSVLAVTPNTATPLLALKVHNAFWCVDCKGKFMLGNRQHRYLLTISDFAPRYLIYCEGLVNTREAQAITVFEQLFKEYGLPSAILSGNGVPFACADALYGLSTRKYERLPDVSYPFRDKTVTIAKCGRFYIEGQKIHQSTAFAGHNVGVRQVEGDVWLVRFMDDDLGYFDLESNKGQALNNPFGPKVLGV
jgi:hypothetical protein